MASTSSIDIMGSLNDAMKSITGSKIDLSLPETLPFATQAAQIQANQELTDKITALQKLAQERLRLKAVDIQEGVSGTAGRNIRAPSRIRNRI